MQHELRLAKHGIDNKVWMCEPDSLIQWGVHESSLSDNIGVSILDSILKPSVSGKLPVDGQQYPLLFLRPESGLEENVGTSCTLSQPAVSMKQLVSRMWKVYYQSLGPHPWGSSMSSGPLRDSRGVKEFRLEYLVYAKGRIVLLVVSRQVSIVVQFPDPTASPMISRQEWLFGGILCSHHYLQQLKIGVRTMYSTFLKMLLSIFTRPVYEVGSYSRPTMDDLCCMSHHSW